MSRGKAPVAYSEVAYGSFCNETVCHVNSVYCPPDRRLRTRLRTLQRPFHPRHSHPTHDPQFPQLVLPCPPPCQIRNREVRLHPHDGCPIRRQHIDPMPRRREQIPVSTNFDAVRRILHSLVNRSLVQEVVSRGVHVESVNRARVCRVPVDLRGVDEGGDGDFAGAGVGDVQSAVVGGEGDAVGLLEGVFYESRLTGLWVEAEGPGSHLGRLGVDGIAAAIVCRLSLIFVQNFEREITYRCW